MGIRVSRFEEVKKKCNQLPIKLDTNSMKAKNTRRLSKRAKVCRTKLRIDIKIVYPFQ